MACSQAIRKWDATAFFQLFVCVCLFKFLHFHSTQHTSAQRENTCTRFIWFICSNEKEMHVCWPKDERAGYFSYEMPYRCVHLHFSLPPMHLLWFLWCAPLAAKLLSFRPFSNEMLPHNTNIHTHSQSQVNIVCCIQATATHSECFFRTIWWKEEVLRWLASVGFDMRFGIEQFSICFLLLR